MPGQVWRWADDGWGREDAHTGLPPLGQRGLGPGKLSKIIWHPEKII